MTLVRMGRGGGCLLCGTAGAACGHPSASVPFDVAMEEVAVVGGPLRKYLVTTPSGVVTTMKLNDADAELYGGVPLDSPQTPQASPEPDESVAAPQAKKRAPANKARTSRTKAGGGG